MLKTNGGDLILLMISVHAVVLEAFLIFFQETAKREQFRGAARGMV